MGIFGKKKEKEDIQQIKEAIEEIRLPTELLTSPRETQKTKEIPVQPKPETREERPSFAPLFIKIDRYKHILSSINYLKNAIGTLQNSFGVLNELEELRSESLNVIKDSLQKIEKKLQTLDSEFLRPRGYHEEMEEVEEAGSLSSTIEDLKGQIEQLKSELQNVA